VRDAAAMALGIGIVALVVAVPARVHFYRRSAATLLLLEYAPAGCFAVTARLPLAALGPPSAP
jgi:hypothetical protein